MAHDRLAVVREGPAAWGIYSIFEGPKWSILAEGGRWRRLLPVIREVVEGDGDRFSLKGETLILPHNPSESLLSEARKLCPGFAQHPELLPIARGLPGFRLADMIRINEDRKSRGGEPSRP